MKQSKAFKEFKERTQEIFNFAVLITMSVPTLKQNIKLFNEGTINRLTDPDYFEPSVIYEIKPGTIEDLKAKGLSEEKIEKLTLLLGNPFNTKEFKLKVIDAIGEADYNLHKGTIKRQSKNYIDNITNCTTNYQTKLATYLYFSTFSYFEAFIIDISLEIINGFNKLNKEEYIDTYKPTHDIISDMIKLDKVFDASKKDRYRKFSKKLRADGYQDPERLVFSSLSEIFNTRMENLKANEIPVFLEKTLVFKMTETEASTFHSIRNNRNSIGHGGRGFSPHLNDVINANKFFKSLSERIDKHVTFYFFNLNNYQKE
jgi:hypothetical protein